MTDTSSADAKEEEDLLIEKAVLTVEADETRRDLEAVEVALAEARRENNLTRLSNQRRETELEHLGEWIQSAGRQGRTACELRGGSSNPPLDAS